MAELFFSVRCRLSGRYVERATPSLGRTGVFLIAFLFQAQKVFFSSNHRAVFDPVIPFSLVASSPYEKGFYFGAVEKPASCPFLVRWSAGPEGLWIFSFPW